VIVVRVKEGILVWSILSGSGGLYFKKINFKVHVFLFSNKNKQLIENIISLFILQGSNYILPLITFPYLVRVLGPEKFGLIAFAQAFIQYFIIITDYGFNLTATKEIAIYRDHSQKISGIFSSVMIIKLFFMIISFMIMSVIIFSFSKFTADCELYFITFLTVIGNVLFPIWFFQGVEKMRYITLINMSTRIIITILIFVCIRQEADYILVALIQSIGSVFAGIVALLVIRKHYNNLFVMPTYNQLIIALKEGWYVFISTAAVSLYTASNMIFLGFLGGNIAVGYFSAADKVIKAVQGLIGPVSQSIYPHISMLVVKSKEEALIFINKCIIRIGTAAFIISLILFLFSDKIILLLLGTKYDESIILLRIMAFLPFIIALSNIFGIQTMLTFGLNKLFSKILIFAGLLNVLLIIPLIYLVGAVGVAITIVSTELFVTISMSLLLYKKEINVFFIKGDR
jgi:PST family polysaccharide transporter